MNDVLVSGINGTIALILSFVFQIVWDKIGSDLRRSILGLLVLLLVIAGGVTGMFYFSHVLYLGNIFGDFAGVIAGVALILYGMLFRKAKNFNNGFFAFLVGGGIIWLSDLTRGLDVLPAYMHLQAIAVLIALDILYLSGDPTKATSKGFVAATFLKFPMFVPALILIAGAGYTQLLQLYISLQ